MSLHLESLFARALHLHRQDKNRLHHDTEQVREFFQTAPISALLEGVFDGDLTFAELAKHGNFGLGTFNALDGEMVAFDGEFLQITADGRIHSVPDWRTPFAIVTHFQPDLHLELEGPVDFAGLQSFVDSSVSTRNVFYAVRVEAWFEWIKTRSVPRQSKPYRPFVEITDHQPEIERTDLRGTLAGFRFPDYTRGLNVPGYHLHFVAADRTSGGHLLDCRLHDATIHVDHSSDLHLELPHDATFEQADLSRDSSADLRQAESAKD